MNVSLLFYIHIWVQVITFTTLTSCHCVVQFGPANGKGAEQTTTTSSDVDPINYILLIRINIVWWIVDARINFTSNIVCGWNSYAIRHEYEFQCNCEAICLMSAEVDVSSGYVRHIELWQELSEWLPNTAGVQWYFCPSIFLSFKRKRFSHYIYKI